jgi:hypothetical protein
MHSLVSRSKSQVPPSCDAPTFTSLYRSVNSTLSVSQIDDLTLHFSALEKQTLWIFEIYALAECLACCQLENSIHLRALVHTTSSDHDHEHESGGEGEHVAPKGPDEEEMKQGTEPPPSSPTSSLFSAVTENSFCRRRAQVCLDRSLKVKD